MKKFILTALAVLAAFSAGAKVELTPLFTDNMVFQQNTQAPVWGKAAPGATVKVTPSWNNKTYTATAAFDGRWEVRIPTPKGSFKKYTLTISDGTPVTLQNVLVGEVWLASGQSNMQMPMESWRAIRTNQDDINNASDYANLRVIQVSRATGMGEHDYFSADFDGWKESSPVTIRNFSAAGWYFGRKLMQDLKVPVGIIHTSWGGTIIEAWMSAESLSMYPEMAAPIAHVKSLADSEADRAATFDGEIKAFYRKVTVQDTGLRAGVATWALPSFDDSSWRDITLPCKVQRLWPGINGIYWYRKTVDIPKAWEGKDLTLSLGPIDDFDETYWDGEMVGKGTVWNLPRTYTIPGNLVKGGKAVICIRNTDDHGDGGLYGDGRIMYLQGPDGSKIMLNDVWKVTLSVSFEGMPKSAAREPNMPTVLYNAMLRPLAPYAIKGAIWYQGESNAEKSYRYRELMEGMILDWRSLWGYDFPFYITQIAGYKAVSENPGEFSWAELREAQALATETVAKTGMACIIDIGEAEDVHPVRKREVGERLANLALANDYGKKVPTDGPRFKSYTIDKNGIVIKFSNAAGGLKAIPSGDFAEDRYGKKAMGFSIVKQAESGKLTGFQIAGADHIWHWADAEIAGDTVIVSCPDVPHPVAVRYGWADNPVCNLFNSEGLPAWPFRTDDWPGLTYGKL
jgi:sialate O-acetylesterase